MSLPVRAGAVNPALLVDALVVRKLATDSHRGVHRIAAHGIHGKHNQSIVEQ